MATTTGTGAKKINGTDNWRDIFDDHNDTVDAYDGLLGTTALPTTAQTLTGAIAEHETDLSQISKSTLRDVPFSVAVSDWSAVTGGFSATFTTAYITASSKEIMTYDSSVASYAKAHINAAKKSGGGGIVFTTATKPTGTISGNAYVFDNEDNKIPVLIEDTVVGIANGGTGQSSLAGAKSAFGITALSDQIANQSLKTTGLSCETGVSISAGGYCQFGNIIIVNLRLSVSSNLTGTGNIVSGLPTYPNNGTYAELQNNTSANMVVLAGGAIYRDGPINAGNVIISGIYVKA